MSENVPPQPQQLYPTDQHHDSIQHAQRGPDTSSAMRHPLSGVHPIAHPMLPGIQEGFNAHAGPARYYSQNHTVGHFRNFPQDITNQLHARADYTSFQNVAQTHLRRPSSEELLLRFHIGARSLSESLIKVLISKSTQSVVMV